MQTKTESHQYQCFGMHTINDLPTATIVWVRVTCLGRTFVPSEQLVGRKQQ
jgi:hypothetical protein